MPAPRERKIGTLAKFLHDSPLGPCEAALDLGVSMSPAVLEHKLEAADDKNPETTWNLSRWPKGFSDPAAADHRLFVASGGSWRGYFKLTGEALFNPDDPRAPYALLFDASTWTPVNPAPVRRFRGFTYQVPPDVVAP